MRENDASQQPNEALFSQPLLETDKLPIRTEVGVEQIGHYEGYCEDSYVASPNFVGVFDGVGKSDLPKNASESVASSFKQAYEQAPLDSLEAEEQRLADVFNQANKQLFKMLVAEDPEGDGLTAQATGAVVHLWNSPDGRQLALVAAFGDSRVYHMPAEGDLTQVTVDNTAAKHHQRLVDQLYAEQLEEGNYVNNTTDYEKHYFAHRNQLTQVFGADNNVVQPRIITIEVHPGDRFVLTTDGVHDNLTTREMEEIVGGEALSSDLATRLAKAAHQRSLEEENPRAKPDDITAMVLKVA